MGQPNNSGWVGFNNNAQTNQNPQPNGGGDFITGQQAQKQSSMNSILGKYHSKPSNQFLTSLPGQQQPQPNMMGMNGMNRMGMNNQMNMMGMNRMNRMGNGMNMGMNNMNMGNQMGMNGMGMNNQMNQQRNMGMNMGMNNQMGQMQGAFGNMNMGNNMIMNHNNMNNNMMNMNSMSMPPMQPMQTKKNNPPPNMNSHTVTGGSNLFSDFKIL